MIGAADAIAHPSPNMGARRDEARPDLIVLHYTAMGSAEGARDWLCNPASQVSAHYVLAANGTLWQLVDEAARAWHAGAGGWGSVADVNSRSVGIEIANSGTTPFAAAQMDRLEDLVAGIMQRWHVPRDRVIGHSDCAPGRKIDPGPRFDWRRLARAGLAIWPEGRAPVGASDFWRDAQTFGYRWEAGQQEAVLHSFRMRFRPHVCGPLDATDAAIMAELTARWPAL